MKYSCVLVSLRKHRDLMKAFCFIEAEHQIHILYSLSRCTFYKIVNRPHHNDTSGSRVDLEVDIYVVAALYTFCLRAYILVQNTELDSTKKDLAAKEVVVTGDVAQQVGQDNATNIINQAKMQIIGDNIQNADEIYNIVYNIAEQNGVSLSQDEIDTIVSLLQQIAQQNYDIQEMKQTLANIQQNLEQSKAEAEGQPTPTPIESNVADEGTGEDITTNVDSGALGGGKILQI